MLPIQFGGLQALDADEITPFDQAIEAYNCYLDSGRPQSRNGYRLATSSAISGSGTVQALRRFRPYPTSARVVAVIGGTVYTITDPSSETATDGVSSSAGAVFSDAANISMAQLGRYMYIGTDQLDAPMRRMNTTYVLETIESLPRPSRPTATFGAISFVVYRTAGLSYTTSSNLSLVTTSVPADWYRGRNAANTDDCSVGEYVYFTLASDENWMGSDWVAVVCTPHDTGNRDGALKISVAKQVNSAPGTFYEIGTIYDTAGQAGTPNLIFCPTSGLPDDVREAVRYIRFEVATGNPNFKFKFGVYGHCVLPSYPSSSPMKYYVDLYQSSSLQSSDISEATEVTIRDSDVVLPTYTNCYIDRGVFRYSGQHSLISGANDRNFNRYAGMTYPKSKSEIGLPVILSGVTPSGYSGTLEVRVWKDVENGRRLVNSQTGVSAQGAYSVKDFGSYRVLSNIRYRPGGAPPRCNALAARSQRLIAGYENRLYISSYIPPNAALDPFPQFPAIAMEESDGWSFDIAASNVEQIQSLVNGDALYILTNLNCYSMTTLEPNSLPYLVYNRGVVGRHAAIFAENQLYWAAYDGIYTTRNRVETQELTQGIRRIYTDWFGAGAETTLAYQSRKLYAFRGAKYLRYDFVRNQWTRGEIAHSARISDMWYDPGAPAPQMWLLFSNRTIGRWQANATSDAGAPIGDWEYSTGFAYVGRPSRWKSVYVENEGGVELTAHTSIEDQPSARLGIRSGQVHQAAPPKPRSFQWRFRFRGSQHASIARAVVWLEEISAMGQGDGKQGMTT